MSRVPTPMTMQRLRRHAGRWATGGGAALCGAAMASLLGGCIMMGPDYRAPRVRAPGAYKNVAAAAEAAAQPPPLADMHFERWWAVFDDARLDQLEKDALKFSPQAQLALARVDGARAKLRGASGDQMPQLGSSGKIQIDGQTREFQLSGPNDVYQYDYRRRGDFYNIPISASYELDLWGRVRRSVESARSDLMATQADYAGVILTLTSQVADTYYTLRSLDAEIAVLEATRRLRQDALDVNKVRFSSGLTSAFDVSRAEVELASVDTDLAERRRLRNLAEDGLALLTGRPASEFALAAADLPDIDTTQGLLDPNFLQEPPAVPSGVPADLLRRRPDIASAERTLAARNADIGAAKALQLPQISLAGLIGVQSFDLPTLLDYPNQVLSGGLQFTAPIFSGGNIPANIDAAYARLRGAYADYKQKVLGAYSEVEDSLGDLKYQTIEREAQTRSVRAAADAAKLSRDQYRAGLVNYLIVVDAERSLLSAERSALQLTAARYKTTIKLIRALGGGWTAPEVPLNNEHWPHLWNTSAPSTVPAADKPAAAGAPATAAPADTASPAKATEASAAPAVVPADAAPMQTVPVSLEMAAPVVAVPTPAAAPEAAAGAAEPVR